jgi:hypothetical protein
LARFATPRFEARASANRGFRLVTTLVPRHI